jgi:hypothetical protein
VWGQHNNDRMRIPIGGSRVMLVSCRRMGVRMERGLIVRWLGVGEVVVGGGYRSWMGLGLWSCLALMVHTVLGRGRG